jgi:hypothetical protein
MMAEINKGKERPILFSTDMVQAILEGRKTQTRRTRGLELVNISPNIFQFKGQCKDGWVFEAPGYEDTVGGYEPGKIIVKCPYGQIGDLLWVAGNLADNRLPVSRR